MPSWFVKYPRQFAIAKTVCKKRIRGAKSIMIRKGESRRRGETNLQRERRKERRKGAAKLIVWRETLLFWYCKREAFQWLFIGTTPISSIKFNWTGGFIVVRNRNDHHHV
jgi:hypothetical protein